jgi:hypothetical protein
VSLADLVAHQNGKPIAVLKQFRNTEQQVAA